MSISIEAVSHLIGQIYDSAYSRESLSTVMANLARLFGGSRACLLRMGADAESFQAAASADDVGDFLRLGHDVLRNDRLLRAMQGLPVGPIVARAQLIDEVAFRRSAVWDGFFRPRDMDIGWTCKLRSACKTHWFLDLQRHETQGPLSETELRLLRAMVPHFERATKISEQIEDAADVAEGLSHLSVGVLLVDARCRIVRANAVANALLERADSPLRATGNKIAVINPKEAEALRQLVRACCAQADRLLVDPLLADSLSADPVPAVGGSIVLMAQGLEPSPVPLTLTVSPHLGQRPFDLGPARRAMIVISEGATLAVDFEAQLRTTFGLTVAETKIALSLVSGLTLKQAAEKSAIRINTARWYLDEIFRKTKTHRQSQLVALLVNLRPRAK